MYLLKDKFTIEEMQKLNKRLNHIFYQVTHYETRSNAQENEFQLLNTIDYLCRLSGMLCDIIEQHLEGNIETSDPYGYIDKRLGIAETSVNYYLEINKINLD